MKLKSITTAKEIEAAIRAPRGDRPLIEVLMEDKTVKGARIGTAHFRQESYSSFRVLAEVTSEEAERHRVTAKVKGFPDQVTYYEDRAEARAASEAFGDGVEVDLTGPVTVLVDASGKVVGEPGTASTNSNTDDLPF